MKPGDFIEWVYKSNNVVVPHDEMLWSTLMQKWVPITGLIELVALTDDAIVWLCDNRLFRARSVDTLAGQGNTPCAAAVPRRRS
jgi:hypothetical protein